MLNNLYKFGHVEQSEKEGEGQQMTKVKVSQ